MIQIIKNDSVPLTNGERRVLRKLEGMYKDIDREVYLYIQPNIGTLKPDFMIIDSKKGVSILEVKDWSLSYIRDITKEKVYLVDRDDINPIQKTKNYLRLAAGIISRSKNFNVNVVADNTYAYTIFVNMSDKDVSIDYIKNALKDRLVDYITSDKMDNIDIDDIFSKEDINLKDIDSLRGELFPETKIQKILTDNLGEITHKDIAVLDIEQENFARKIAYGHYMVTGVPGSGKTVILITRAIHLLKENPNWRILIVSYNTSLSTKIKSIIDSKAKEIEENEFINEYDIGNIEVRTFHSIAKEIANVGVPRFSSFKEQEDWWREGLPNLALDKVKPTYDAVLIDEYQDFYDDWIRLCINLCKPSSYKNSSGQLVNGVNLFMAGDRIQSIYNSNEHSWSSLGINMQGRSKLLKVSYRAGKENINLALKFLQQNKALSDEIKKFYKEEDEKDLHITNDGHRGQLRFLEGDYESIAKAVVDLKNEGYKYNEILIICDKKRTCEEVIQHFPSSIRINSKFAKDLNSSEDYLIATTYYSSKGLESKAVILVGVNMFKEHCDKNIDTKNRKLLYVGMTRAAERLYIHSNNFESDNFATDVKYLYSDSITNNKEIIV